MLNYHIDKTDKINTPTEAEMPNKTATVLTFPSQNETRQTKEKMGEILLDWLYEADYNWQDRPSTF